MCKTGKEKKWYHVFLPRQGLDTAVGGRNNCAVKNRDGT
jgi:hypothetical protein